MKRGEIGKSGDDLRVVADRLVVNLIQDSHQPITTGDGKDGPDLGIPDRRVQLGGSLGVRTAQIAITAEQIFRNVHRESQRLDPLATSFDPISIGWTGRSDESDQVAGAEGLGLLPGDVGPTRSSLIRPSMTQEWDGRHGDSRQESTTMETQVESSHSGSANGQQDRQGGSADIVPTPLRPANDQR